MTKKSRITPFMKQCFVTAAVSINMIGHGAAIGFPAILLPQLSAPGSGITLTKVGVSWIASVFALCMLTGNLIAPPIMDRLGRKVTHYVVTVPYILGWLITIQASSVQVLIIGRSIHGFAGGLLTILRSVLIGECTSPRNRGAYLTVLTLAQAFGIFFVHLIGSLFNWQQTSLINVFFPFISLLMILVYSPESPSWLAAQGRYDECREVFRWLRGDKEDEELEEMINARVTLSEFKANENKQDQFKLWNTMKKKEFYKPVILMNHAIILIHFAGGTTMAAFSVVIISLLMGPNANAHFWMVFLDIQRIISNAIAVYVINRTKRRTMMFSTGGLCVISHLAIAIYIITKAQGWFAYDSIWLPAVLVNLQYFAVAVGMAPIPNMLVGEVFPLEYRSIGGTIVATTGCGFMFLVLYTFPELIHAMGLEGTYILYAAILTYNLLVIWVLLPETRGKTLQQIEDEFRGRPLRDEEIEANMCFDSVKNYMRKSSDSSYSAPKVVP